MSAAAGAHGTLDLVILAFPYQGFSRARILLRKIGHGLETRATKSFKLSMHKPFPGFLHTEDPEALCSRFVFDVKVVARLVMSAPPLARDALGADGVGQAVRGAATTWAGELDRETICMIRGRDGHQDHFRPIEQVKRTNDIVVARATSPRARCAR